MVVLIFQPVSYLLLVSLLPQTLSSSFFQHVLKLFPFSSSSSSSFVMPLLWKKPRSGRISRFVSDLQQSPKHCGSLVVETGFPTSLIDLFVKNHDRLKKASSKRNNAQTLTAPSSPPPPPPRRHVSSPSPPLPLQSRKLDSASVTEDPTVISKIKETTVGCLPTWHDGDVDGGGGSVSMVGLFKIFLVAVLASSTKKLAVGITLSAFALLFLELAVARVFTLLNLSPRAQFRLIRKQRKEKLEESSSSPTQKVRNRVSSEIIEEETLFPEMAKPLAAEEKKKVLTIRDVVFMSEKSKSSKLKSKIVKKLRSYKKKEKMKNTEREEETVEIIEEEESVSVSDVYSEISDVGSNPPVLESSEEIQEEEGDGSKAMCVIVIVLAGLLSGKVFAIGLTVSSCLILDRVLCCKSQTSL